MDPENSNPAEIARPYFIPPAVDFKALPAEVRAALSDVIEPAYKALVLHADSTLERLAGVTLVFLLTLEVLDQFQLGREFEEAVVGNFADSEKRAKQIGRHLRLIASKQTQLDFLFKLRNAKAKYGRYFP